MIAKKRLFQEDNSENIIISDVLTYDELVSKYAEDNNLTEYSARVQLEKNNKKESKSYVNSFGITAANTYRSIAIIQDVADKYKPKISFYCKTSEGGGYWGIQEIVNTSLIREYTYTKYKDPIWDPIGDPLWQDITVVKGFNGSLFVNLVSAYQIHYIINGDFTENATTTQSSGASINIGGVVTFNFTTSVSSNFYKYWFNDETKNVQQ